MKSANPSDTSTTLPLDGGGQGGGARAGGDGEARLGSNASLGAPTSPWSKADQHLPGAVTRARNLRRRMTLPEKLLWAERRKLDLNIRRQAPIGRYIPDFIHHPTALVVEIDSARHDLTEDQLYDVERTQWLNANGYQVLRYRNEDVIADADAVANQIRVAIAFPSPPQTPSGATG